MHILIVQLSDLHIKDEQDSVLRRADLIAASISTEAAQAQGCVLVLNGDIAFSGIEDQYGAAHGFIAELVAEIARRFPHLANEVKVVGVPGNHDCDFGRQSIVREMLLASIRDDPNRAKEPAVVELCCQPQDEFFMFLDAVSNEPVDLDKRLYWTRAYSVAGQTIEFICLNTAFCSILREQQGEMVYPASALMEVDGEAAVSIAIMHHPYNWLRSDNGREVREQLERMVDVVLTGHEHVSGGGVKTGFSGETTEFIEAGALQETNKPDESVFNVLLLDTARSRQRLKRYVYDDDIYVPQFETEWEAFQVNRLKKGREFALTDEFASCLDDPGVNLQHPDAGQLKLGDVYVFPDMRKATAGATVDGEILNTSTIADSVDGARFVYILGQERGGKTSLAKSLFRQHWEKDLIPVFVNGSDHQNMLNSEVPGFVRRHVARIYDGGIWERYCQLDASSRILIVDNAHALKMPTSGAPDFWESVGRFFRKVILIGDDLGAQLSDLVQGTRMGVPGDAMAEYQLLPMGHVKRSELVERWCLLGSLTDETALAKQITEAEAALNLLIGRNFVPPYPVFILAVLQNLGGGAVDVRHSSYGYFYELFIRNALATGSSKVEFNIKITYLANLAYSLFARRGLGFSPESYREAHKSYCETYGVDLDIQEVRQDLLRCGIFAMRGDDIGFKYAYIYYYFVASYLRDHITTAGVRADIVHLCESLYVEEHANIVLFLAHVSTEPLIIEQMVIAADSLFTDSPRAELGEDVKFLAADREVLQVSYYERTANEARHERNVHNDENSDLATEYDDVNIYMQRISAAVKTLQILGQLLKNFPGSLTVAYKEHIAMACYDLGFRVMGSLLVTLKDNKHEMIHDIIVTLMEEESKRSEPEIVRKAEESLTAMTHMLAFATVRRIAASVGAPTMEPIYRQLNDIFDSPLSKLVGFALSLDRSTSISADEVRRVRESLEKKGLALSVLRHLVVSQFYLYPIELRLKQRICAELDIPYKGIPLPNPRRRLLPS